jgi:hypothetical protein
MDIFSLLPPELQYLISPAKKFGQYQFDGQVDEFLDRATQSELEELASVAERFRLNRHSVAFDAFLDRYPITDHDQSALLCFLFGVIDAAGFDFSPPDWNSVESHMDSLQRVGSFRLASERAHAARFLADFGCNASPAIPLLGAACNDEDERVRVWAHYALAKVQGNVEDHIAAILSILSSHNEIDEFGFRDEIGTAANSALELLTEISG